MYLRGAHLAAEPAPCPARHMKSTRAVKRNACHFIPLCGIFFQQAKGTGTRPHLFLPLS
jgi:hypothetical protein